MRSGARTVMRTWDPSAQVSVTAESVLTKLATGPIERRRFRSMADARAEAIKTEKADVSSFIGLRLWYCEPDAAARRICAAWETRAGRRRPRLKREPRVGRGSEARGANG